MRIHMKCHALYIALDQVGTVVQFDACPTGDQEVASLTPAESAAFFCGDWSWNTFYGHSLPSADSNRSVVSFWWKNVHNTD